MHNFFHKKNKKQKQLWIIHVTTQYYVCYVLCIYVIIMYILQYVPVWLSGRALRQQRKRLWVRFPGNTHTNENV